MSDENESLEKRVCAVAARTFEVDFGSVAPELARGSLQAWDSIGHLNLMMDLEREFSVRFSTRQIEQLQSLTEIVAALVKENVR